MPIRRKSSSSSRVESWSADSRSEAARRRSSAPRRASKDVSKPSRVPVAPRTRRGPRESIANALLENLPNRTGSVGQMGPTGANSHASDTKLPPTFTEQPVRTPPARRRGRR